MRNILKIFVATALLPVFLLSCGGGGPVGTAGTAKKVVKPEEKKAEEPVAPVLPPTPEPALKNPFQSYVLLKRRSSEEEMEIKGPLECCELRLFKLAAAVVTGDKTYALLNAPDGKRYIVRVGDKLGTNNGKIAVIDTNGLVVREPVKDLEGNIVSTVDIDIKMFTDDADSGGKTHPAGKAPASVRPPSVVKAPPKGR